MSEVQQLESYISGQMLPGDKLVMDAHFLLDPALKERALWQKSTYSLIRDMGRKELRQEIEKIQARMFTEGRFSSFRQTINNIFRSK